MNYTTNVRLKRFIFLFLIVIIYINSLIQENNCSDQFYSIAKLNHNVSYASSYLQRIHLIRVPKASSSSLSAIARRIVGCDPYGPCCKYPGDPPGSCPRKGLFACHTEGRVVGCTGHDSNYRSLLNKSIMSITMVREPYSRAISAFFYGGSQHNNRKCNRGVHLCFLEYTTGKKFRNPVVKLLTGAHAYSNVRTCRHMAACHCSLETAKSNMRHLGFLGVSEMWELSVLLLHFKIPSLLPILQEFQSPAAMSSLSLNHTQIHSSSQTTSVEPRNLLGLSTGAFRALQEVFTRESDVQRRRLSAASTQSATLLSRNQSSSSHESSSAWGGSGGASSFRMNTDENYTKFKRSARWKYNDQLYRQNDLDVELYIAALERLCGELHQYGLWRDSGVRAFWKQRIAGISPGNSTMPADVVACRKRD